MEDASWDPSREESRWSCKRVDGRRGEGAERMEKGSKERRKRGKRSIVARGDGVKREKASAGDAQARPRRWTRPAFRESERKDGSPQDTTGMEKMSTSSSCELCDSLDVPSFPQHIPRPSDLLARPQRTKIILAGVARDEDRESR